MFSPLQTILLTTLTVLPSTRSEEADADDWPRLIEHARGTITVYQPQPESFGANKLAARAAFSVIPTGSEEPVFGAVWFEASVLTDRDARTVEITDIDVPRVHLPDANVDQERAITTFIEGAIGDWHTTISLDRLLTTLEDAELEQEESQELANDPPAVVFTTVPTELVALDGDPKLHMVKGTMLMRVANTPSFLLLDADAGGYFLLVGEDWWFTSELSGKWERATDVSGTVEKALSDMIAAGEFQPGPPDEDAPKVEAVLLVREPTTLIATEGEPAFTPLAGTGLLYLENTTSDVFLDIDSQKYFLMSSGRWFVSGDLENGPWLFMSPDALPEGFAKIPEDSPKGHVLAQVAGTTMAKEAVLDTYIPQTAKIARKGTTIEVTYDGDPVFQPIEGTELAYAVNTAYSVIRVAEDSYFCCSRGVWFTAEKPDGPWVVCIEVPQEIYELPASCPHYSIVYVRIYDHSPEYVWVGYTPGYVGCYVQGNTVVYGTGYVYVSYVSPTVYYPAPVTYYQPVVYQPYSGWSFAAGVVVGVWIGNNWDHYHHHHHGRWHRHGDVHIDRNIYVNNPDRRPGNRPGAGRPGVGRPGVGKPGVGTPGPRDRRPNAGPADSRRAKTAGNTARKPNNVYADRNGNVHRRTDNGWQSRQGGSWRDQLPKEAARKPNAGDRSTPGRSREAGSSRQSTRSQSFNRSKMESQHRSRSRGASRQRGATRSRGGGRRR